MFGVQSKNSSVELLVIKEFDADGVKFGAVIDVLLKTTPGLVPTAFKVTAPELLTVVLR